MRYARMAVVFTAALVLLTGCGKKDAEIEALRAQNASLSTQIADLSSQLENATQITELTVENSLFSIDGKPNGEFKLVDGKINFPKSLMFPEGTSALDASNSLVRVGSKFIYYPSDSWLVNVRGTTLNFSHPADIWGSIRSVKMLDVMTVDQMKAQFTAFFKPFPSTNISYKDVFLDDTLVGMIATAPIKVEGADHVVTAALVFKGDFGQIILFDYKDNKSGLQQELINALIKTGTSGDFTLKFD